MASIPDKFIDILPRSFIILLIVGGLIVVFTSPIASIVQQWLGNAQSLEEKIYFSAIVVSASLIAGLPVIMFESPIIGNAGLYHKLGHNLNKSKERDKIAEKLDEGQKHEEPENFDFMSKVDFYSWLNKKGCNRFLDHLNLQNSIVNAFFTGFTISFLLSLLGSPIVFLLDYFADWYTLDLAPYIVMTLANFLVLLGLWQYNLKSWKPEREEKLKGIGKQYRDYLKSPNKEASTA